MEILISEYGDLKHYSEKSQKNRGNNAFYGRVKHFLFGFRMVNDN